jgi:AbrB family looped-hinge helix DNA binding protein
MHLWLNGVAYGHVVGYSPTMTSVIDTKSRIVIPAEIRERLALAPGDKVDLQTDGEILTVAKVEHSGNRGLVRLLLACPVKDFMPRRRKDFTRSPKV